MAIGRTFERSLTKAIRSLDIGIQDLKIVNLQKMIFINPSDERLLLFYIIKNYRCLLKKYQI